jgi:hypothetical protein
MTAPVTMQSVAMRRSGAMTAPVTMQSEAMRRSGAMTMRRLTAARAVAATLLAG